MRVAVHDMDVTQFPNLALMKLSTYHKSKGHTVSWFSKWEEYDRLYASKVFMSTKDQHLPKDAYTGGTGFRKKQVLADKIEHICPDYSLYGIN